MFHRCVQFGKGCGRRQTIPAALPHHPAASSPAPHVPVPLFPPTMPLVSGSRSTEVQPVGTVDQSPLSCPSLRAGPRQQGLVCLSPVLPTFFSSSWSRARILSFSSSASCSCRSVRPWISSMLFRFSCK